MEYLCKSESTWLNRSTTRRYIVHVRMPYMHPGPHYDCVHQVVTYLDAYMAFSLEELHIVIVVMMSP